MRELGQVVSFVSLHAFLMNVPHMTVSLSEIPRFVVFGVEYLYRVPYSSFLILCAYKFYDVFALFFHFPIWILYIFE